MACGDRTRRTDLPKFPKTWFALKWGWTPPPRMSGKPCPLMPPRNTGLLLLNSRFLDKAVSDIEPPLQAFVGYVELGMYEDARNELDSLPLEMQEHPMVQLARLELLV